MKDQINNFARWNLIFMLLSMDSVNRFWNDMGLMIKEVNTLQRCAGFFIKKYHEIENDISLSNEERIHIKSTLLQNTFAELSMELGENVKNSIEIWGNRVFQYEMDKNVNIFFWRFLLRRLAGVSGLNYRFISFKLQNSRLHLIQTIIKKYLGSPFRLQERIQIATQECSFEQAKNNIFTPDISPLDWVENTIEFVNTMKAVQEIHDLFDLGELKLLREWGVKQAIEMGIPSDQVEFPDP